MGLWLLEFFLMGPFVSYNWLMWLCLLALNGARSILLCMGKQKNESSTQLMMGLLSARTVLMGPFVYCKNVQWGTGLNRAMATRILFNGAFCLLQLVNGALSASPSLF